MTTGFDQFFEGGAKSFSFDLATEPRAREPRGGKVLSIGDPVQQTDMLTGNPLWWDPQTQQRPKLQVIITIDTRAGKYPEPSVDDSDDGVRTLYAKAGVQMAISEALRDAKSRLQVGGFLYIAWVSEVPAKTRGFHPRKVFKAQWTPPTASEATGSFFGGDAAPAQQQAAPAPQFGAPTTPPAPAFAQPVAPPYNPQITPQAPAAPQGGAVNPFA